MEPGAGQDAAATDGMQGLVYYNPHHLQDLALHGVGSSFIHLIKTDSNVFFLLAE